MKKIIININNKAGRPKGSDDKYITKRNGYIVKAHYKGMKIKTIAGMMGLSNQLVSKVIKDNK